MDMRVLFLTALTAGCVIVTDDDKATPSGHTGIDDTDTTPPTTGDTGTADPDNDNDGFPASTDCDDNDPAVNPDAEELCDGIDNDCDNATDDAAAATLNGANHADLDAAIAAAVSGDIIDICPGTWSVGAMAVSADTLTLSGVGGRDVTTINETKGGTVAEVSKVGWLTLEGLTVTGATGVPALSVIDSAQLDVIDCAISGNTGSGISITGGGSVINVTGTDIDGNSAANGAGIQMGGGSADMVVTDSNINNNVASGAGGGIFAEVAFGISSIALNNTTIDGNSALTGGGVVARNVPVTGDGSSFISNNSADVGGGAVLTRSPLSGVLVSTNSAIQGGGVAMVYDALFGAAPLANELLDVVVDLNTADQGGGLYVQNQEAILVDSYSAVTLNTANYEGGGAYVSQLGTLDSQGADWGGKVSDNSPDDVATPGQSFTGYEAGAIFTCNGAGCI